MLLWWRAGLAGVQCWVHCCSVECSLPTLQRVHQLHEAVPDLLRLHSREALWWRPGHEGQLNLLEWRGCCRKVKWQLKMCRNGGKGAFTSFWWFSSFVRHCCRRSVGWKALSSFSADFLPSVFYQCLSHHPLDSGLEYTLAFPRAKLVAVISFPLYNMRQHHPEEKRGV